MNKFEKEVSSNFFRKNGSQAVLIVVRKSQHDFYCYQMQRNTDLAYFLNNALYAQAYGWPIEDPCSNVIRG